MAHEVKIKYPCWLLLGPEIGRKKETINKLKDLCGEGNTPEETSYYAGETSAGEIVSDLRNGSLFADSRLFLVKNAENLKKKEDIDLLASYIASPQSSTVLVLISEETSIARGLEKAVPPAAKLMFYELLEKEKIDWVASFFRAKGFRLSDDGIQTILELVENNTQALEQECSRLILFFDKDKEIGPEEVEQWLSHTREESSFTLFSRIAAGDFSRSLESVRTLLAAKEAPQSILAGLLWCFKRLRDYTGLKEAGIRDEGEYRKIGIIAPQAKRDYAAASRLYSSAGAETCIALTAEYDYRIRSSGTFPNLILLDEYLYRIQAAAVK